MLTVNSSYQLQSLTFRSALCVAAVGQEPVTKLCVHYVGGGHIDTSHILPSMDTTHREQTQGVETQVGDFPL